MALVAAWIAAERDAGNLVGVDDPTPIALDRVRLVLAGEVRWSEALPGDRAIWRGRARDVRLYERLRPPIAASPYPWGRFRYGNVYDTARVVRIDDEIRFTRHGQLRSLRLFENANVGAYQRTNMFVAGQLGGWAFVVSTVYATATDFDGLVAVANNLIVTLVVGEMPVWMLPLRELVAGVPTPQTIPPRQNFYVYVDAYGGGHDATALPLRAFDPFDLAIHIEGVIVDESAGRHRAAPSTNSIPDAMLEVHAMLAAAGVITGDGDQPDPATAHMQTIDEIDIDALNDGSICGVLMDGQFYCARPAPCQIHG